MPMIRLPLVLAIALIAALAGGVISHIAIPNSDPEMKALLRRQVELAEKEDALREQSAKDAKKYFGTPSGVIQGDGKPFKPEW